MILPYCGWVLALLDGAGGDDGSGSPFDVALLPWMVLVVVLGPRF